PSSTAVRRPTDLFRTCKLLDVSPRGRVRTMLSKDSQDVLVQEPFPGGDLLESVSSSSTCCFSRGPTSRLQNRLIEEVVVRRCARGTGERHGVPRNRTRSSEKPHGHVRGVAQLDLLGHSVDLAWQ